MRQLFWFFLFVISFGRGHAQTMGPRANWTDTGDYIVKQYNSENGLPQNSARDLLLDHKKFLWIATEDGLVRFDGQRFKIFNMSNTPILKWNRFSIISETPRHDILLGSSFDRNEIYKVTCKITIDTPGTRLLHKSISKRSNGIFDFASLYGDSAANKKPAADTALLNELCKSQSIEMLNEHEIVVHYRNEMYYLNNTTGEVVKLPVHTEQQFTDSFFAGDVFCFPGEKGKLFFFRHGRETTVAVDPLVAGLFAGFPSRPSETVLQVYVKGDLLLCRHHNDIYRLRISNNVLRATLLFKNLDFLDKLPVSAFAYDEDAGRLFAGTQNAGVFIVTKKTFNTLLFNSPDLYDNVFMAFQELPGEKILTSNGIFDLTGNKKHVLFSRDKPDRICIYKAADQSVWMSRNGMLNRYDSNFSGVAVGNGINLGAEANAMTEDHTHALWVCTEFSLFRVKDGKLQARFDLLPHIRGRAIESIIETEPGILWIATRNGLYSFDMASGRMSDKPLLPNVYARSIFRAKDSSLWIGTYGKGYYKYSQGAFAALPLDPQKYLANTHAFLEDDNGFFWVSTNHGLFKLRKADLDSFVISKNANDVYFYYFDKSCGFSTNEFNGGCNPAGLKDKHGNFYFPSLNGLVCFNPGRVQTELPVNKLFIENFQVDAAGIDHTMPIKIKPDFDQVFVDIATPFFGLNDNLDLLYRLNTVGEKWYPVNAGGRIIINRLPYGKYTLLVRQRKGWGRNGFTTASISFEVLPHWYNTRLFYISLLALVLMLGFLLYKVRMRILLRQNLRLKEKVEQRTLELYQSTLMKEKLISVIVHDLRSPLAAHSFLIDYLYKSYNRLPPHTLDELFFELKDSSDRICHFSGDFLTWYNSQKQGWDIRRTSIDLNEFLVRVSSFYREATLRKNAWFEYDIAPGLVLSSDEYIFSIVVRNVVDNAVKYTKTGGIRLLAFEKEGVVYIQVKDTGQGMPASRINELLEYADIDINRAKPTFGYLFIIEFTRKLGGKVAIESEPGSGTTVTIAFGK